MGFRGRVLPPAALLLCSILCHPAAARNIALLVGVGQFHDPGLKGAQLFGVPSDLASMQKALTQHWGFQPGDVVVLRDQDATHDRVLEQIAALEQRSAAGDTVLIYYSGHGTSANDNHNKYDLPYATGAWVPYDVDVSSPLATQRSLIVGRRDLVPRLSTLDKGGRWVVVVSDSCFSGQVVRSFGQTHSQSRYLPLQTRDLGVSQAAPATVAVTPRPDPPPYPYQHVLLLSGASDSETGADISSDEGLQEAPTLDHQYHGAFTDAFLRLLDGQFLPPGSFNYAQGRQAMVDFMEHRFPQHPQLLPTIAEDPLSIGTRPFLALQTSAPAAPAAAAAAAATATRAATLHVRLESVSPALKTKIAGLAGVAIVDAQPDMTVRQRGDQVDLRGPAGDPIVTKPAGDPALIKRISAQAWLDHVLPASDASLGLRAETDPGSRGDTFVQCESFVFEVRLQKSAYVMVLDLDSDGKLTVLYPTRAAEREIVAAGAARAIPSNDPKARIQVTAPFGTDQVAVLAFERQPSFFADLNGVQPFAAEDGRAQAIAKGLAGASGGVGVQQIAVHTYPATGKVSCGT
jgi:Caspase domain/Domain of unknown function (DUF4384)